MSPDSTPPPTAPRDRAAAALPLMATAVLVAALFLAWQALALPLLVTSLRPLLGEASPTIVQLLSVLLGGWVLYAIMRALGTRSRPAGSREPGAMSGLQLHEFGQALPIGMLLIRGDRIVDSNPPARHQLGLDAGTLATVAAGTLFTDPRDAEAVLSGAGSHAGELKLRRGDGDTFRAQLTARTVKADEASVRVVVFDDLSISDRLGADLHRHRQELHALTGRLLTVQEDERRVLSRELHDDIGQAITAIKLAAVALLGSDRHSDGDPRSDHVDIVQEIIATADQTVVKLRNLSMLLRPPQLDALGLEAALRWQSQLLFRANRTALTLDLTPLPRRPDAAVELACFRIAQEALTNVLRHSAADNVTVSLSAQEDTLVLRVQDDGHGFDTARSAGLGLVTMRERAQQLGGSVRIQTMAGDDCGTCVHALLPMTAPA